MVQFDLLIENALSVGAGAIEFILCHAEVEIAFAEEKKVDEVCFFIIAHLEFICLQCPMNYSFEYLVSMSLLDGGCM